MVSWVTGSPTSPTPCGDLGSVVMVKQRLYNKTLFLLPTVQAHLPRKYLVRSKLLFVRDKILHFLKTMCCSHRHYIRLAIITDGVTWTSTGELPSYTTTQSATTWYQCIVTCTLSGQKCYLNTCTGNHESIASCYCVCRCNYCGLFKWRWYIGNVTLSTINNTNAPAFWNTNTLTLQRFLPGI